MNRKWLIAAAALIPLVLIAIALLSLPEPDYEVIATHDGFELRRYQPFNVAETDVEGAFEDVSEPAFERLVGYLQRGNAGGRNLPMMAPVVQQPLEIPPDSTPTIDDAQQARRWRVQFAMPKEYPMSYLPAPADERVKLRRLPTRVVAAKRCSGSWAKQAYLAEQSGLLTAIADAGLVARSAPGFARYNAAFVPWFLRRNEVLVEIDDSGLSDEMLADRLN